jgi:hypothetical protein
MSQCVMCGRTMVGYLVQCNRCGQTLLLGQIEQLRAEVDYLRGRCEEEGVAVQPRECWPGRPGPVSARAPRTSAAEEVERLED